MIKEIKYDRLYFKLEQLFNNNIYTRFNVHDWGITEYNFKGEHFCIFIINRRTHRVVVNMIKLGKINRLYEFTDELLIDLISEKYNTEKYEILKW